MLHQKILVPVDGFQSSLLAEEQAINIARKFGSKVSLLYVVPTSYMLTLQRYAKIPHDVTYEILKSLEQYGKNTLSDAATRFREEGLEVETVEMGGEYAEKILSFTDKKECDLIVMGSLGEYLEGFFLEGSVERVARLTRRPILIVKKKGDFSKILVAVDGSEQSEKAFMYAIQLAKKFNSKITLLNVVRSELFRFSKKAEETGKKILSNMVSMAEGVEPAKKVEVGHPAETIIRVADSEGYNLVVLGSKGLAATKGFFIGSVSENVIRHTKCSILIVK